MSNFDTVAKLFHEHIEYFGPVGLEAHFLALIVLDLYVGIAGVVVDVEDVLIVQVLCQVLQQ